MRWMVGFLFLVGCAPTNQERLRELTNDGLNLYRQGAYLNARETFRTALDLRPNDPDLLYNLGRCHDKMGNPEAANQLYQQCLEHNPDHPEARHAVISRLHQTGKHDEAVRLVSAWMRSSPNLAAPFIEDGWLYAQVRDFDSARGRFQQALVIEPRNARALAELAQVCETLERQDLALVLYERSLESNADQPSIRDKLIKLQAKGVSRPHPD